MAPLQATNRNYYDAYAFEIVIDGLVKAAFNKCTGLTGSAEVIEYAEGGEVTYHKAPGMVSFGDITLERGETDNDELYRWWKIIWDQRKGAGADRDVEFKREVIIRQKTRAGKTVRRWQVYNCWPSEFGVSDWDNQANEHHIEHLVLVCEGFEELE